MQIIGVIDLKDGRAVHARGGRRDTYAAVREAAGIAIDGSAAGLARVYVETFGLDAIYVADLDAIASQTPHADAVTAICRLGASVMLDAGITTAQDAQRAVEAGVQTIVVGLETLRSFDALSDICRGRDKVAFSLDLREGVPLSGGAAGRHESPEAIAAQAASAGAGAVIVLDLARVGSGVGPDLQMLRRICQVVREVPVLAGGGVRDIDDLSGIARVGCGGALVASALHNGRLRAADVAAASSL